MKILEWKFRGKNILHTFEGQMHAYLFNGSAVGLIVEFIKTLSQLPHV